MTLIYPYFNYCNIIWGAADPTVIKPLNLLKKKLLESLVELNIWTILNHCLFL